jgi:hypothetical protein
MVPVLSSAFALAKKTPTDQGAERRDASNWGTPGRTEESGPPQDGVYTFAGSDRVRTIPPPQLL